MKTMTVRDAEPQLGRLLEKVQHGAPVILVQGDKNVRAQVTEAVCSRKMGEAPVYNPGGILYFPAGMARLILRLITV
jgi:hypothetical protein